MRRGEGGRLIYIFLNKTLEALCGNVVLQPTAGTWSRSRLGLGYLRLVRNTLFCPNFASHINKWAKSAVAIMAVLTRIENRSMYITYWLIIINGHENKVTTVVIITCRPMPILISVTSRDLYKRLVSVSSWLVRPARLGFVSVSGFMV